MESLPESEIPDSRGGASSEPPNLPNHEAADAITLASPSVAAFRDEEPFNVALTKPVGDVDPPVVAPTSVAAMELTALKAKVVSDIPLSTLEPDESSISEPAPEAKSGLQPGDLPPAVAAKDVPHKPQAAVLPSLGNAVPAAFSSPRLVRNEIESSPDFIPGGAQEPDSSLETPEISLSPKLGAMTIDAERADSDNEKNTVTFTGNVTVDCKRFALRAERVVSFMRAKTKGGGMSRVEANGKVTVRMNGENGRGYLATGSRAVYDTETETIRLTGWPKIEEAGKSLVANSASTEILIDTRTSRLTTTGATKTLLNQ